MRQAIMRGEFAPGERLVQEELAEAMGVSRMPIREALRQLEKEGLIMFEPHKGAVVTSVTTEDIEEIYQLRAILEWLAIERSMPNLTEEDKKMLKQLTIDMERAVEDDDIERFVELNDDFHRLLRKGCGWRRTQMILDMLWHGFPPHTPNILPRQIERSLQEHRKMVELIETGDLEGLKRVIQEHILRTGDALKQYLDSVQRDSAT
ncbi:transcription regulator [Effusibacillus dendaii]|uniref:Transcription regulator n=1 Tax=Effusibacillus dendaii TaxID=2743772 RepID=A0A7I8D8I8_9BACL|nr:transcription regulator [Effusibacillus dendaii]